MQLLQTKRTFLFTIQCFTLPGPPPPPSPPQDEKAVISEVAPVAATAPAPAPIPTTPPPVTKEDSLPREHTNSLKKPQPPAVPEDDGFTR